MKTIIKLMSLMSLALFSMTSMHGAGHPPQKNYDDITAQKNLVGGAKACALHQFLAMIEAQRAAEEGARQVAAARSAEDAAGQVDESKKTG